MVNQTISRRTFIEAACAFASILALSGCSQAEAEAIKLVISSKLDGLKTYDEQTVRDAIGEDTFNSLTDAGVDISALYEALLAHFSYDNVAVDVQGDSAKVTLDVTNIDVVAIAKQWFSDNTADLSVMALLNGFSNLTENGIAKTLAEDLCERMSADDVALTSNNVRLDLAKKDGQWALGDDSQLVTLLLAGASVSDFTF